MMSNIQCKYLTGKDDHQMNFCAFLGQLYDSVIIPLSLYRNGQCILSYPNTVFLPNPVYTLLHPYFQESGPCLYSKTPEFMQCGFIRFRAESSPNEEQYLLIGPALENSGDINNSQHILRQLGETDTRLAELHRSLIRHSSIYSSRFLSVLKMMNNMLNHSEEIQTINMTTPKLDSRIKSSPTLPDHMKTLNQMPEKEILDYIKYGKPRELLKYILKLPEIGIFAGELADSHLRSLKNTYVAAVALASRTAIEGGLDYNIALALSDEYIYRMERITDGQELLLSLGQMLIEFAKQTQKIRTISFSDPLVLTIINDIFLHINEKITVESIAHRLNYSAAHLCRHFKKITGKTLIERIQEIKIEESQKLLKNTDMSLLEISARLAFSSQSYYQKVFRKVIGMTPMQYRYAK